MLPVSDYKNHEKKTNRLAGKVKLKVLIILAILIVASFFSQMVLANNLATDGQILSKYEKEIQTLEAENTLLKVKISQEASLNSLAIKAEKMGYLQKAEVITP